MPNLHHKYYYNEDDIPQAERSFLNGYRLIESHPLFRMLSGDIYLKSKQNMLDKGACVLEGNGKIYVNINSKLDPDQWAYTVAHALLHLAFGHFDKENMPEDIAEEGNAAYWNKACDIYITRFLNDIKFGESTVPEPSYRYNVRLNDEQKTYEHLKYIKDSAHFGEFGTNIPESCDMIGLDHPIVYAKGEKNMFKDAFVYAMNCTVNDAVSDAGGHSWDSDAETPVKKAAEWFLAHYPLLGSVAASFKIIENREICQNNNIHVAAVDATLGEIYCNPLAGLNTEEWKFVLAHEYLHAGLMHHKRSQGRDHYLWNIACDFCVNAWLKEMDIGIMPKDALYDKELKDLSAEAIYDRIVKDIRMFRKLSTFRGNGLGDILGGSQPSFEGLGEGGEGVSLDEFYKNALREGLDYHTANNSRGYLPEGLVQEIRALTSPPIPWEVELGQWFDCMFPPVEKHRSYARPSRRQSSSPDIPRPRYVIQERDLDDRTFGVVVDTSGSVSLIQLGLSLGAIASYAASKDVRYIRIVFCDAEAYDQGYMTPDDLAGRVKVTGRGGTILQPGIDVIQNAKDFPKDGPILIITDGYIESKLRISREHAYLIPKGNRLPFQPKGKVFYFK